MPPPLLSIIIPTHARPRPLRSLLEALVRQDEVAGGFEVVVVDDGSPQSVAHIIDDFRDRLSISLRAQENQGPAAARNAGAHVARGRLLAFIDDDCEPTCGWAAELVATAEQHPGSLIGGRTRNAACDDLCGEASQQLLEAVYAAYNGDGHDASFFASNNILIPADAFAEMGGFNTRFRTSEDRELCRRWKAAGKAMVLAPDALSLHRHEPGLRAFWLQHFGYGRGAYLFHRSTGPEHEVPAGSGAASTADPGGPDFGLVSAFVLGPVSRLGLPRAVPVIGLVTLSQVASAVGYAAQWRASRRRERGENT